LHVTRAAGVDRSRSTFIRIPVFQFIPISAALLLIQNCFYDRIVIVFKRPELDFVLGVVRNNKDTAAAKECEVLERVRNWFRFSKDRDGGREERRKKKEAVQGP
jgi:hypothetical protein